MSASVFHDLDMCHRVGPNFLQFSRCIDHRVNFSLVQMTVDGRRPPPSFFAAARRSLLQHFADDIRSEKDGLCRSVIHQDGLMIGRTGNQQAKTKKLRLSSECALTPKDAVLQKEVDKLRTLTIRVQSERDRARDHLHNARQTTPKNKTMILSAHQNVHQLLEKAPWATVLVKVAITDSFGPHMSVRGVPCWDVIRSCGIVVRMMLLPLCLFHFRQAQLTLWMHGLGCELSCMDQDR